MIELERALARLRRETVGGRYGSLLEHHRRTETERASSAADPGKTEEGEELEGTVWLSRRACLLEVPAGTHEWCERLQSLLGVERERPPGPPPGFPGEDQETVLLFAHEVLSPHRPAEVRTELLAPPVDELLRRAASGLGRRARSAFAREHGAAPEDLEGFLAEFLSEGVLERR